MEHDQPPESDANPEGDGPAGPASENAEPAPETGESAAGDDEGREVPRPPLMHPADLLEEGDDPLALVESLLYAAEDPVTAGDVVGVMSRVLSEDGDRRLPGRPDPEVVAELFHELEERYLARDSALSVFQVAGGWRLGTRPRYDRWIRALRQVERPSRLSMPALETLAVVAYRQPVTTAEVSEIRGVDASTTLRTLRDQRLIRVTGRKKTLGRPFTYGTTEHFLETFGLRDLDELPEPEEFEELLEG